MLTEMRTEIVPKRSTRRFGAYTLLEDLAKGGMAQLYLARRDGQHELCVVKRLLDELSNDPVAVKRFQRESAATLAMKHHNIARTLDAGCFDSVHYMVSEYIPGITLDRVLMRLRERYKALPIEVVLAVGLAVLDGLTHAHELKDAQGAPLEIVHRDISPRNILVSYGGEVKVIDFGVARAKVDEFKTAPGVVVGSLEYMSPEQALTQPIDRRSDLYSLSVVLYEALSGNPLVPDGKLMDLFTSIVRDEPPPIGAVRSGVPSWFEASIMRGLKKSPQERWQSAREYAALMRSSSGSMRPASPESLGSFLHAEFPDDEQEIMAKLERGRLALEEELEAARLAKAGKNARYEATAIVERPRKQRRASRDAQPPSEYTKLGAVVLDMPGEPAPLTDASVRVEFGFRQASRYRRAGLIAAAIATAGLLGVLFFATQRALPPQRLEVSEEPQAAPTPTVPHVTAEARSPEAEEEVPPPVVHAAPAPAKSEPLPARRRPQSRSGEPSRTPEPKPSAPAKAAEPDPADRASDAHPAIVAPYPRLRHLLMELRNTAQYKADKRYDELRDGIMSEAQKLPREKIGAVRANIIAADINRDIDTLAQALEELIKAKNATK
jgi:serine/threonine-protein kinase